MESVCSSSRRKNGCSSETDETVDNSSPCILRELTASSAADCSSRSPANNSNTSSCSNSSSSGRVSSLCSRSRERTANSAENRSSRSPTGISSSNNGSNSSKSNTSSSNSSSNNSSSNNNSSNNSSSRVSSVCRSTERAVRSVANCRSRIPASHSSNNNSSKSSSSRVKQRSTISILGEWKDQLLLLRLCRGMQSPLLCCLRWFSPVFLFQNLHERLVPQNGNRPTCRPHKNRRHSPHVEGWHAVTRPLRLGLLLLGGVAGVFCAASSGQLPLLLPIYERLQPAAATAAATPAATTAATAAAATAAEHQPNLVPSSIPSAWAREEGGEAAADSGYYFFPAAERDGEEREDEPSGAEREAVREPQKHRQKQEEGREEACMHCMQQLDALLPPTNSEAGGLTSGSITSPHSGGRCSVGEAAAYRGNGDFAFRAAACECWEERGEEGDFAAGKEEQEEGKEGRKGGGGEQGDKVSLVGRFAVWGGRFVSVFVAVGHAVAAAAVFRWDSAAFLWLLLLLFHFVPKQEKWPLHAQRRGDLTGEVKHAASSHRSSEAATNMWAKAFTTEKTGASFASLQQQALPLDLHAHAQYQQASQQREEKQQQQQQAEGWYVVREWKKQVGRFFLHSVVERGEMMEVFLQGVELSIVGFFLFFFLAKTLFGCESILRQLEAHFMVLLLLQHLQEYLFYFLVHPEKLSVDRLLFNNSFLYAAVVAVSLLELLLKPYELAAAATLANRIKQAAAAASALHHTRLREEPQASTKTFSLLHPTTTPHGQLLSQQKYLLQSVRVNLLLLGLSWAGHFFLVPAAGKPFFSDTDPAHNNRPGSSNSCCVGSLSSSSSNHGICSNSEEHTAEEADMRPPASAGAALHALASGGEAAAATTEEVASRVTRRSDSCCCCCSSWHAVCGLWWRRMWGEEAENEAAVAYNTAFSSSRRLLVEGSSHRQTACCSSLFSSSSSSGGDDGGSTEDSSHAGVAVRSSSSFFLANDFRQAFPALSSRCSFSSSRDFEESSKGEESSCWQLSFLLCCWIVGAVAAVGGIVLRALAHFTARRNFTHQIACAREENSKIITHGIYAFSRHPGYAGTFYWASGVQLMVGNIIVLPFTIFTMYVFLSHRIVFEERMLERIFPAGAYAAYRAATPTIGIPFLARKVRHQQEEMATSTKAPPEE